MTRSTGHTGSTREGSPPRDATASRIAARSAIAGTPVKSCMSTREGRKEISRSTSACGNPAREVLDVPAADEDAVFSAQQVLEQDLQRVRERVDVEGGLEGAKPVDHGVWTAPGAIACEHQNCWRTWRKKADASRRPEGAPRHHLVGRLE